MDLKTYISKNYGSAKELAQKISVAPSFLSQMAGGIRSVSPENAVAIERATNSAVTRQDLRPDDWEMIWPELVKESFHD